MSQKKDSPIGQDISDHYASGYEAERLSSEVGQLEYRRTVGLLERFLPKPPATVLDIGGGTGVYAFGLAELGYAVHLIDIVPLHIEIAQKMNAEKATGQLASASVGNALSLDQPDETVDACLMMGPLYHLTKRTDRLMALREGHRVLKSGGVLLAAGVSRFASTLDGLRNRFLFDPAFFDIVKGDLADGRHRNPTGKPEYFMDTFFHHPDELCSEMTEAGFNDTRILGIEGPGWLAPDFDSWWNDEQRRERLLYLARELETEPSLLGISAHLMAVGRK